MKLGSVMHPIIKTYKIMLKHFIYSDKWLDLLFENKNKQYGAYLLRKREADTTLLALFGAIGIYGIIAASIFFGHKIYTALHPGTVVTIPKTDVFKIFTFDLPPLPHPPVYKEEKQLSSSTVNSVPKVMDDKIIPDDDKKIKVIDNPISPVITPGITPDDLTLKPPGGITSVTEPLKPILVADVAPEFPGGMEGLQRYLEKNIQYPRVYIDSRKGGLVYLQFVVDETGNVTQIEVKKGVKDAVEFENEAVRVVKAMPRWKPGIYGGKNASVYFTLPVNFMVK